MYWSSRDFQPEISYSQPHGLTYMCLCMCFIFYSLFVGLQISLYTSRNLVYTGCLCCWRQQQQFTITARYTALFLSSRRGFGVYILYQTACYLGVVGTETAASKQNHCMCSLLVYRTISLVFFFTTVFSLFLSLSFPLHPLFSTFHSFSLSLLSLFPPLSLSACGPAPAVPGKSWLWYPRKTSQRV